MGCNRIDGPFSDLSSVEIHAAHSRVSGKGNERCAKLVDVASPQAVLFLGQDNDAASFRRFIGQRRKLSRVGQPLGCHSIGCDKFNSLAIPKRDRPGLIEQQRVDIAGCFDCSARGGNDIGLDHTVHASNADC